MSNVPKLRFREFSGEWEEKAINKVAKVNPKSNELSEEFIYIDLESVEKGILVKENLIAKSDAPSRAQRLLENDDILFQTVRPYQKNNYYFSLGNNYVASTGYAQLRAKESSLFLYQILHTEKFANRVMLRCTGTSYPAINSTDLATIEILIPTKPEQEKIASFLTSVDTKIEQLTKKETLLKEYKKGVTSKIFNQKIRFKNDDGSEFPEWEEKRLGEITYKASQKNKDNFPYPVYSINNKKGFIPQNEQFEGMDSNNRNYDISLYKIIDKNTFAYNPARINVGSLGYSGDLKDIIISSLYVCFKTNEEINDEFLLQYFSTFEFNKSVLRNTEGGVRDYLFYENFSNIKTKIPCYEEQTKIANFLSSIDKKIELTTKELNSTKEFKKALLQQMFV